KASQRAAGDGMGGVGFLCIVFFLSVGQLLQVPIQPPRPTPPWNGEGTEATPPPLWGRLGGGEQLLLQR
ncbi:MAG TPA: hypothetical protein PL105_25965, partial [Caldilineaceae bacterium]|nr:hypothetical protein [Caldilineaceae bacterium]